MRTISVVLPLAALAALVVLLSPAPAAAQAASAIRLENPWARRAPAQGGHGGANGAVYVTIRNDGVEPDALVSAVSDAAARGELHETAKDGDVMKMRPLPKLDVAARGLVEMKPGGHHIMLLGLKRDLKPGDRVTVTLTFEKAGPMSIEAPVR
ncbi:MAG: hypothetical protein A2X52_19730 [Candidatus Rokubacteria bacterium GWC2_70_16]|nr:MAG: hypothetical protein A2X52_19730 [Candidatus Rokubacteria bacterium GWC2_70_16]